MNHGHGESWRFSVTCTHADCVYLVKQLNDFGKKLMPMKPVGPDVWALEVDLLPGHYHMSYFTNEGETFINGGSYGLSAIRIGQHDPDVIVDPIEPALTA